MLDLAIVTILEVAIFIVVTLINIPFYLWVCKIIKPDLDCWDSNTISMLPPLIFNTILIIISIFIFRTKVEDRVKASIVGVLSTKIFLFMVRHVNIALPFYMLLIAEVFILFAFMHKPWYYYYAVLSGFVVFFIIVLSALMSFS